MNHPKRIPLACILCFMTSAVLAGTTADPMQPSPKWLASQPGAADAKAKSEPMETQVIVYSPERKIAVVDGVLVRIGDVYNGERLVAMKPREVHWKHADGVSAEPRPAIVKKIIKSGEKK